MADLKRVYAAVDEQPHFRSLIILTKNGAANILK